MKVSPSILSLIPYKPGKPISETQREYGIMDVIKLASNENPLGASPKAVAAMQKALGELHRYPDPSAHQLSLAVSRQWGVAASSLAYGNGSNEIIDILIRIYCSPGEKILTTDKAFIAYQVCAQAASVETLFTPLRPDFTLDLDKMAQMLLADTDNKIRIVFIPNPNNPTGTYVSKQEIEQFLGKVRHRQDLLIVFDEAYTEFVRAVDYGSGQQFMATYPQVAVVRTLSKVYGLAGLRLGILLAAPEVIEFYNRVRNPFNVNHLAQVAAIAALEDYEFIQASQKLVWQGLGYFYGALEVLKLPYVKSQANFVLFDTLRDANKVYEALLKKGIILRPVANYGFPRHLRMSIGLEDENKKAIQALTEVLAEIPPMK